jgi:uncharacterized membrane protein
VIPTANDFVPLFPWLAPLLVGLALGRPLAAWRKVRPVDSRPGRALAALGRWSLVFYLVHQPVLFALATGLAAVLPVDPAVERALFLGDCTSQCESVGADAAACRAFCGCVAVSIDGTPIWQSRTIDSSYDGLIATVAASCRQAPGAFDDPAGQPAGSDDDD